MTRITVWTLALWVVLAMPARADLTIEITQGADNPVPIAVVPFGWSGSSALAEDMAQIVANDLQRSGLFAPLDRNNMLSLPAQESDVVFRDWRVLGSDYLVIGQVTQTSDQQFQLRYSLFNVLNQRTIATGTVSGSNDLMRDMAHRVSDLVYEKVTGRRGAFSTRILYVTADRHSTYNTDFRLNYADADGHRARVIYRSKEPILSPSWSPDAKRVSYVSFDGGRPGIYVQELATGKREQITRFPGLNSAPAWSPDGKKLALVLSKSGNADIYIKNLNTGELKQVTRHYAIDTEPFWMPDGKSLVFTSNRGGSPQIYQVELESGWVERLTFEGKYNARARVFDDGKALVLVHKGEGAADFNIAVQNLENGRLRILTSTLLDDSPSIAPNGDMLIYATHKGERGILAAVSADGRVKFELPSNKGDVREPAWSPFLN
ncbi:Tol-Pal system beta propeller repeat protein TolB [Aestuariirhabdus sp. Z084]|uniref:Tol-Pal system beta propeller repeat protein TolB n=1 Tax=Aestuariirhabdus haliotis TaxID=2918751 RepID=UPI00201B3ACF|nr:Tol-Pal system beta propeller repeat protein TolB [Aestuariirhabdus haliotis]MCL6416326.1 Tol-Pal system beta propeller repeat protein TolB [Aestuariirhabdus haliotis]MCL6420199.1 Tol-Pal system beta propeller repeat protein TolB [Aestuariirhabdus haliotis]